MLKAITLTPEQSLDQEEAIIAALQKYRVFSPEEIDLIRQLKNKEQRRVEEVLYSKFPGRETKILKVLCQIARVSEVNLSAHKPKPELLKKIPLDIARKFKVVVFEHLGGKVYKLATAWPTHPAVQALVRYIEEKNRVKIELYGALPSQIESVLKEHSEKEEEARIVSKVVAAPPKGLNLGTSKKEALESLEKLLAEQPQSEQELREILKKGYVPQMIAAIISFAIFKRASDIHLQPLSHKVVVRYRIDGVLSDIAEIAKDLLPALVSRVKILADLRIDERRKPQDGRFSVMFKGKKIDLRVSTLPTVYGEKVVMRILEKEKKLMDLKTLGLEGINYQRMVENIRKPYGMIIVTGPTGSGKTTTLYAALSMINRSEINIVTLEDPVEYEIEGISQSQIKPQAGFTFASGLRSILRQDPDVIMIGEVRDKETAEMAIHAALTGHLVLTTLHTNNASGAIPRLVDMGIEPFLIASAVNLVVAQRLVRRLCPFGKVEEKVPSALYEKVARIISRVPKDSGLNIPSPPYKFYKGIEDSRCHQGYLGRIGVFETIEVDEEIQSLITQHVRSSEILRVARKKGMVTMFEDALVKAVKGITSLEEALRVSIMGAELKEQF